MAVQVNDMLNWNSIDRLGLAIIVIVLCILGTVFASLKSANILSPNDVKLSNLSPCREDKLQWTITELFQEGEDISICADLSSNAQKSELYYYLFDENQYHSIYSDAQKFGNGSIVISLPNDLAPGKYSFEIRWGREVLGVTEFIVVNE